MGLGGNGLEGRRRNAAGNPAGEGLPSWRSPKLHGKGERVTCPGKGERVRCLSVVALIEAVVIICLLASSGGDLSVFLRDHPRDGTPSMPMFYPFVQDHEAAALSNLVMVPGHAATVTEALDGADHEDFVWYLLSYQRGRGVPSALVDHIEEGVRLAAEDPLALLIFSGGMTRVSAGPVSEAASYYNVAKHYGWFDQEEVQRRTTTEEFARDSFENLLFSIARFREVTGHYPRKLTVVGYDFKEHRYSHQHRKALRWPESRYEYIGLPPPGEFEVSTALDGEDHTEVAFAADPYACLDESLVSKKALRNPFSRTMPYTLSCPEMFNLLQYCGKEVFGGDLPWASSS